MSIGFIGVGKMGVSMARNLVNAGYTVSVYDINPDNIAACIQFGAFAADSSAELVRKNNYILTSVTDSDAWVEVAQTVLLPNAKKGKIFIDLGTAVVEEVRRLAPEFEKRGASLLDVPVSGGPTGAENGNLRMFVGGNQSIYTQVRSLLEVLGNSKHIVYCGGSGSGQIVKYVNQIAMGLANAAQMEAIALGVKAGIDVEILMEGVGGDEPWRLHFNQIARMIAAGQGESIQNKYKQFDYFLKEAEKQGIKLPLVEAIKEFTQDGDKVLREEHVPVPSFWRELMKDA